MEKRIKPKDWIKLEPFAVINKLGLHYDISTAEIAEKAGYDRPQAFYDVMSGKTKKISPKMAEKIKNEKDEVVKVTADFYTLKHKFLDELDKLQDTTPVIPINLAQIVASHKSNATTGIYATGRQSRKNELLKNLRFA